METTEKRTEQADLPRQARSKDRTTRGPLGTLMLVAWVGFVFMYFVTFFNALLVFGAFVPPILIFAVLTLLGAGVVATGFRPAPLLASVVALVTLLVPIIQPHNVYVFTHPAQARRHARRPAPTALDGRSLRGLEMPGPCDPAVRP